MNQNTQAINNALAIVPAKRKRGRPRKYPTADAPNYNLGESSHSSRSHGGANNHVPPGFRAVNGNQPRQVEPIRSIKPGMAGQAVSGVIEGEFDGGYLLTVKVRNSDITLRGVVFKPGRCAPVTGDNDVAPNIQMIHRNEVPLHSEGYSRVYNPNPRSRARNGSKLASPPPSVQSVGPARGSIVPIVLSNVPNQDSSQPVALQVVHPSVESAEVGRKFPKVEEESSPEPMEQDDAAPAENGDSATAAAAAAAAAEPRVSIEDGPRNGENHHRTQFSEPLSVQNYSINNSDAVRNPVDNERTGKMTELLQAVQENAMKNQLPGGAQ